MNAAFTKKIGGSSIMLFFLTAFLFGTNLSAQWTNYCVSVNATNNTDCEVTLYCDETADGQSIYNMGTIAPGQTKTIYPSFFGAHVYTISTTGGLDDGIYADDCGSIDFGIDDGCSTSCDGQITGLQINPQDGSSMINLTDGAVFCESDFANDIRLRALASGSHESLKFTITGAINSTKTENYVTYDSYQFWANPGIYYVNVQLYSNNNLSGTLCDEQNFSFTVEDCSTPPAPDCNLTASASSSATTICDGGSATISATASGANTCSDITNYYKINDTDPTCSGVFGQGVIFRRASGCDGNHEPWTAGSDLYLTEYADGTALISGSIHNGNQTGTVNIELEGEANSGQHFNGSCYVNDLGNVSHFYTGFWGTITVGGTEYSVEPKGSGADFILGDGAGNDGSGFGLGAWTAGTWGGCTEFFMNLTPETIPSGSSETTYAWTGPGGFTSGTSSATVTESGTYSVTVTDCAGCTATDEVTITIQNATASVTASGGPLSCDITSVTLTGGSSFANASYAWTGPNGFISDQMNATVSAPGTYTVTASEGGCSAEASVIVMGDAGVPGIWATGGSFCQGSSFEITGSTDAANGTYSWAGPGGFTSNQLIVTVDQPGTYTLTVTGANGCSASVDAVVTLFSATTTASNNGPITCANPTVQLSTNGANVVSYAWAGPNGYTSTMQSPVVSVMGTYTVTVELNNGCSATASTIVTGEMNMPTVTASNNGPLTCTDASVQLSTAGSNVVSYLWTGPNGYTSAQSNPAVVSPGTYTVTVSSVDGCTSTASTTVAANTNVPVVSAQGAETCSAAIVQLIGSSTTPGVSYSWTGPAGFISPAQNPFVSNSGTYTLTVTAPNGCTASTSVQASIEFLSSGINVVPGEMTCTDDPMPFQAINAGVGAIYAWDFGAGATPAGSTNLTQSVSWSTPGIKVITLTVTKGDCTETYQTTVDVMPCQIDLELTKTVDQMVVLPGEDVTWTISVVNQGPSVATGVMVSDALPAGLTYLASNTSQGTFNPNTLLWNLGTLPVNGTATLTVTTSVDAQGTFVNTAQVASHVEDDLDSGPGNDDGDQSEDDEDNAMVSTIELAGLGDYAFVDLDEDGIQDAGEPGLAGVVVKLFDATNLTAVLGTTTTDANGFYEFLNLDPSLDYVVQFMMAPAGYALTTQSGNASAGVPNDSNAGAGGFTDIIDLNPGEYDATIDAGYILKLAVIGDYTWKDTNGNGIQDPGEAPLAGVIVSLFESLDLLNNQGGATALSTITTGADGSYLFDSLDPNLDYVIQFTVPNALSGCVLTVQNSTLAGGDDTTDSDADPLTGYTDVIMVEPCDTVLTVDAGFTPNFLGQIDIKALLGGATGAGAGGKPTGGADTPLKTSLDYGFIMHDKLREKGLIPTTEPYSAMGMGGNGETVDPSVLAVTGENAIVDWVVIEARDANDMTSIVGSRAALITRVGNVVEVDGVSKPSLALSPGHYYISLRHRNHMGVMTNDLVLIGAETAKVDFIDPTMTCFGEGALEDIGGANVMHAGDLNHDGEISFQGGNSPDTNIPFFDVVTNTVQNPNFNVNQVIEDYCQGDINLKGEVRYQGPDNAPNDLFFKVVLHPDNANAAANFAPQEQLPENME